MITVEYFQIEWQRVAPRSAFMLDFDPYTLL